jgi:hypothetical protein
MRTRWLFWARRLGTLTAAGGVAAACASADGDGRDASDGAGEGVAESTEALYVPSGTTLWNSGTGTSALVPVCFAVAPSLMKDGSTRYPSQSAQSDRDGNTITDNDPNTSDDRGKARQFVRELMEDSWMRYANVEFVNWGDCPIVNGKHVEANLGSTVMIHFKKNEVDWVNILGKSTSAPTHMYLSWDSAINGDHNAGNTVHEMGHALGFAHEWTRADWTAWKCTDGAITSGIFGQCLDAADGTKVTLAACNPNTDAQDFQQGFTGTKLDGTLRAKKKCLDIVGNATANGSLVQLFDCDPSKPNQQWVLNSDNTLFNEHSGKCLDAPSGASNVQLQIYDCHGGANQRFTIPGNAMVSAGDPNNTKVLDLPNSDTTNGNKVQLNTFNQGINQSVTQGFDNDTTGGRVAQLDGTLRIMGKCLDLPDNGAANAHGTANGTKVQIFDCNKGPNQLWSFKLDGTVVNPASGRCLAVPNTNNGTQLQISDCNGSNNQKWKLPYNEWGQAFGNPPDQQSRMQYCIDGYPPSGLDAWDVLGVQALYGRKPRGSLVGYRGQCANIKDASTANGASIIAYPCRGQTNDTWFRDSTGTNDRFKTPNSRCLNVANASAPNPLIGYSCNNDANEDFTTVGVEWHAMGNMCVQGNGNGNALTLQACKATEGKQKWDFFHTSSAVRKDQIRQANTTLCVVATGVQGENLKLQTCDGNNTKQRFTSTNAGLLAMSDNTGLCANVAGRTNAPGTAIILWNGCTTNPPIGSRFSLGGTIKSLGACMTTDSPANPGQLITAATCASTPTNTQIWEYYF